MFLYMKNSKKMDKIKIERSLVLSHFHECITWPRVRHQIRVQIFRRLQRRQTKPVSYCWTFHRFNQQGATFCSHNLRVHTHTHTHTHTLIDVEATAQPKCALSANHVMAFDAAQIQQRGFEQLFCRDSEGNVSVQWFDESREREREREREVWTRTAQE